MKKLLRRLSLCLRDRPLNDSIFSPASSSRCSLACNSANAGALHRLRNKSGDRRVCIAVRIRDDGGHLNACGRPALHTGHRSRTPHPTVNHLVNDIAHPFSSNSNVRSLLSIFQNWKTRGRDRRGISARSGFGGACLQLMTLVGGAQ